MADLAGDLGGRIDFSPCSEGDAGRRQPLSGPGPRRRRGCRRGRMSSTRWCKAHQADHVGDALMAETSTALRQRQPDLVRAVPVQDDDPRRHARMSARSTISRNALPSSRLARSRRCDRTHETGGAPKRLPLLRDPRDHRHPRSRFWANSLSRPFSASTNGPFPVSACFFPQRGNRLVRSHRCVLIGQARSVARHLCCPASLGQHQSR